MSTGHAFWCHRWMQAWTVGLRAGSMTLLSLAGFFSGLSIRIAEPLLPRVAQHFSVELASAAALITAFAFAYGFFQLVHGPLGDRIGKIRAVCVAVALAALGSAGCAMADTLGELVMFRFLTGMTAGAVIPLSLAHVGDTTVLDQRQARVARFVGWVLAGSTLGPLVGGLLSDVSGWRVTFILPTVGFAVIAVLLVPAARQERVVAPAERLGVLRSYLKLVANDRVRRICACVAIEAALFYGAFAYLGAFMRERHGVSYTLMGLTLAGFGIGGLLFTWSIKRLLARLGPPRMVRMSGRVMCLALVGLALSPWFELLPVLLVLLGFGYYLMHNTLQTRATEMAPDMRGAAIAVFAFSLFSSQSVGIALFGLGVGYFGFEALLCLAGALLLLLGVWLRRNLHRL
ncbi:MAG: MFS transporter [Gammaproteobacteria bacterium]|nr:MFS transporter [Gammaproteobacteria bacterium]